MGWTIQQSRLYGRVLKALQADRLGRLAMEEMPNEPVLRRQLVDKTARRLRQALAHAGWVCVSINFFFFFFFFFCKELS